MERKIDAAELAKKLGAELVGQIPELSPGPFGSARLPAIIAELKQYKDGTLLDLIDDYSSARLLRTERALQEVRKLLREERANLRAEGLPQEKIRVATAPLRSSLAELRNEMAYMRECLALERDLLTVIKPEGLYAWLKTPNPAFGGETPLQLISRRELVPLHQMVYILASGQPG